MIEDKFHKITEDDSYFLFVFMPAGDVLRDLAAIQRFVFLIESSIVRVDVSALRRL